MATLGQLAVDITANVHPFTSGLMDADNALVRFANNVTGTVHKIKKVMLGISAAGVAASAGFTFFAAKLAGEMERTETSMQVALGSARMARQVMAEVEAFASRTPFALSDLTKAASQLIAFGAAGHEVVDELKLVGDIAAGINAPIGEIATLYGKARVQGRLFMQDINQLTGRGIPIIQELAEQFGVAESAVGDLVSSGQVNFEHLRKAFQSLTGEGGIFADKMAAQADTFLGALAGMKNEITGFIRDAGRPLLPLFKMMSSLLAMVIGAVRPLAPLFGLLAVAVLGFASAMGAAIIAVKIYLAFKLISFVVTLATQFGILSASVLAAASAFFKLALAKALAFGGIGAAITVAVAGFALLTTQISHANEEAAALSGHLEHAAHAAERLGDIHVGINPFTGEQNRPLERPQVVAATPKAVAGDVFAEQMRELQRETALLNGELTKAEVLYQELIEKNLSPLMAQQVVAATATREQAKAVKEWKDRLQEAREENDRLTRGLTQTEFAIIKAFEKDQITGLQMGEFWDLIEANEKLQEDSATRDAFTDRFAAARDELEMLTKGLIQAEIEARKFIAAGGDPAVAQQFVDTQKQIDAFKKAQEDAKREQDKLKGFGESLFEQTRTPAERMRQQLEEIDKLAQMRGKEGFEFVTDDFLERARKRVQGGEEPRFGGALEAGSQEAFSAVLAAMGRNDPAKKTEQHTKKMADNTSELVQLSRETLESLKEEGVIPSLL